MKRRKLLLLLLMVMLVSLAVTASTSGALDPTPVPAGSGYRKVTDTHDLLSLKAPMAWDETESGPWVVQNKEVGVFVAASPDLDRFYNTNQAAGVFFGASRVLAGTQRVANPALGINPAITRLLNSEKSLRLKKCQDGGRFAYQDPFYQGQYDVYQNCTDGQSRVVVLVTMPAHQEILLFLEIRTTDQADAEVAEQILKTYQVLNTHLEDDHHQDEDHTH